MSEGWQHEMASLPLTNKVSNHELFKRLTFYLIYNRRRDGWLHSLSRRASFKSSRSRERHTLSCPSLRNWRQKSWTCRESRWDNHRHLDRLTTERVQKRSSQLYLKDTVKTNEWAAYLPSNFSKKILNMANTLCYLLNINVFKHFIYILFDIERLPVQYWYQSSLFHFMFDLWKNALNWVKVWTVRRTEHVRNR